MVEWGREVKEEQPKANPLVDRSILSDDRKIDAKPTAMPDPRKEEPNKFRRYFDKFRKPTAFVTLLYGDTGSGKTYTAMTFPEPVFFIDTENRASNTLPIFKDKSVDVFCPMSMNTELKQGERPFNEHKTIENIEEFIIDFAKEVLAGKIKKGTLVIDSVTDLWTWIWEGWAVTELSNRLNKDGSAKADPLLLQIKNQFDWKVPNRKHYDIVNVLRSLIFEGIHVVMTAREDKVPDYVKTTASNKDRIRGQKDIPFLADTIWHLGNITGKHIGICEKLVGKEPSGKTIENLTYDKIVEAMK